MVRVSSFLKLGRMVHGQTALREQNMFFFGRGFRLSQQLP